MPASKREGEEEEEEAEILEGEEEELAELNEIEEGGTEDDLGRAGGDPKMPAQVPAAQAKVNARMSMSPFPTSSHAILLIV